MDRNTILFTNPDKKKEQTIQEIDEKGYNAIDQMVGYILSGDPSYITGHNNARNLIRKVERDELVEELLKKYLRK